MPIRSILATLGRKLELVDGGNTSSSYSVLCTLHSLHSALCTVYSVLCNKVVVAVFPTAPSPIRIRILVESGWGTVLCPAYGVRSGCTLYQVLVPVLVGDARTVSKYPYCWLLLARRQVEKGRGDQCLGVHGSPNASGCGKIQMPDARTNGRAGPGGIGDRFEEMADVVRVVGIVR